MAKQSEIDEAIQACDELQVSDVYGDTVKRVLRNTKEELVQMGRPRKNPIQTDKTTGYEYFDEIVTAQGNTGRIYPPKDWVGYTVRVIKLD